MAEVLSRLVRHNLFRKGLPFVIFVAGGSIFLKQFSTIRYDFRSGRRLSKEEAESMGFTLENVKQVEQEMLKEIEEDDLEDWENIRGPRPWEDSKTVQKEQRETLRKQKDEN